MMDLYFTLKTVEMLEARYAGNRIRVRRRRSALETIGGAYGQAD